MKSLNIQSNKLIGALLLIICFSFNSLSQDKPKNISIGKEITLRSEILNEDRDILISLPDNYMKSNKKFPVLYILDGGTHFQQAKGATSYLAMQGLSPEIIVVAIPNIDRNRDFTPNYVNRMQTSGGGEKFHNFLEKELIPHIEKKYRASRYKILMGHSLGGMFAAYSLLEFPGVFNSYISVSPYFQYDDNYIVNQAKSKLRSKYSKTLSFYMTIGDEPGYLETLDEFSALVKKSNTINFLYIEMKGENHATTPYLSLFNGLRFTFSDWIISRETISKGLSAIDEHFKQLSEKFDYRIDTSENIINFLGYQYLQKNKTEKSIEIFIENVKRYPKSANVYDSLGEAYEKKGKFKLAKKNYQKAFDLGAKQSHMATDIFKKNLDRMSKKSIK